MNIIQIGCHDGNDHVYEFIVKNSKQIQRAILIDPLEEAVALAKEKYKFFDFVEIYKLAIVDIENIDVISIYLGDEFKHQQTTSIFKEHVEKHQHNIKEVKVPCCTLNALFDKNNLSKIDRLYIDAEGLDCKIIDSIQFNKFDISYLEYEYIHSDGTDNYGQYGEYIDNKLKSYGYQIRNNPPFNKIAIKL